MSDAGQAKQRVRERFTAAGDAYVRSLSHATAPDLARMVERSAPAAEEIALDLATGGGHVAKAFLPHVAAVIATDLTPAILTHAARFLAARGNVRFAVVDAEAIPFVDAACDIVTCRIAPHHFPHPERFVAESARVLKPGGRFVLVDSTVPDDRCGEIYNRFEAMRDRSHVRSLSVGAWSRLIEGAGLVLDHVEEFRKRHDFADWTSRGGMSPVAANQLAREMIGAGEAFRSAFEVEADGTTVNGFSDTKTLFVAVRP